MVSMQVCVEALRDELADRDFVADSALGGASAQVRFIGRFGGEAVVWNATLTALAATNPTAPQYLDVGTADARGILLRIGLAVRCIDRPTVMKAIVMVRNYKRLLVGRHEFGLHASIARSRMNGRSGE